MIAVVLGADCRKDAQILPIAFQNTFVVVVVVAVSTNSFREGGKKNSQKWMEMVDNLLSTARSNVEVMCFVF